MIRMKPAFWAFNPEGEHSALGPSSYGRWKACPASVELSRGIYIPDKSYNIRGTLCHNIAEAIVRREYLTMPYMLPWQVTEALKKREQEEGDSDDILWVSRGALDAVEYFSQMVGEIKYILFEQKIPILGEMWGSADVAIIGTEACVILDYKFGNTKVKADAEQLKAYLMGIFNNMEFVPDTYNFIAGIYQPSINVGYDEYLYSKWDMIDGLAILAEDIQATKQPDIYPNDGSHCFFCPAAQTSAPERKCPMIKMKMHDKAAENLLSTLYDYGRN